MALMVSVFCYENLQIIKKNNYSLMHKKQTKNDGMVLKIGYSVTINVRCTSKMQSKRETVKDYLCSK